MNCRRKTFGRLMALLITVILVMGSHLAAYAEQSDDNSLSSLGIQTQGVTVSPDFEYDHLNYDVVVPAGTTELSLQPVLSNPNATINSIEGTTLENGSGTVTITTTAPSGAMTAYTLTVTTASDTAAADPAQAIAAQEAQTAASDAAGATAQDAAQADVAKAQADAAAAAQSEIQSEPETEDSRYVKVDRNTLQDAEDTIARLQNDLQVYKDRNHQFTYVIYALIAGCVILLFLVVNLALRRKDLAAEVKEYRKHNLAGNFEDSADVIPEDGWLDDPVQPEKPVKKKKKSRKAGEVPQYAGQDTYAPAAPSMTKDGRVNVQTPWTEQQVGTPVQPARQVVAYNGYARSSKAPATARPSQAPASARPSQAPASARPSQAPASGRNVSPQPAAQAGGQAGHISDDTRLYRAVKAAQDPAARNIVPGDETIVLPGRKLTRAEKAAAKKAAKAKKKAVKPAQIPQGQVIPQADPARVQRAQAPQAVPSASPAARQPQAPQAAPQAPARQQDVTVDMIDL